MITAEKLGINSELFEQFKDSGIVKSTTRKAGIKTLKVTKRVNNVYVPIFEAKYIAQMGETTNVIVDGLGLNNIASLLNEGYNYLGTFDNIMHFERPEFYVDPATVVVQNGQTFIPASVVTIQITDTTQKTLQLPSFETRVDEVVKLPDGTWVCLKDYTNADLLQMRIIPGNHIFGKAKNAQGKYLTIQEEFLTFPLATQIQIDELLKVENWFEDNFNDSIVKNMFIASTRNGENVNTEFFVNLKSNSEKSFSTYTKPNFWFHWFPNMKYTMTYHLLNGGLVPENPTNTESIIGTGNFGQTAFKSKTYLDPLNMFIKVKPIVGQSFYDSSSDTLIYDPNKPAVLWVKFHEHNITNGYNGKENVLEYCIDLNTGKEGISFYDLK